MADGRLAERAHITAAAAGWLQGEKRPGEPVGLAVERDRDGWQVVLRIGDVGVGAHVGPSPDDDTIRGLLVGLLGDARRQAEIGERMSEGDAVLGEDLSFCRRCDALGIPIGPRQKRGRFFGAGFQMSVCLHARIRAARFGA